MQFDVDASQLPAVGSMDIKRGHCDCTEREAPTVTR